MLKYDQAVVDVSGGARRFGSPTLSRPGSFAGMPYSAPVNIRAGENEANNVLVNEFTVGPLRMLIMPGLAFARQPDWCGWLTV